ncbi:MAG: endonuclease/exonuclease/phosphatase family protein [Bacillota bacterium]
METLKLNERQWQGQSSSIYENKSLKKCEDIARALIEINADIIMLCEVGGFESLKNFNHLFMNEAYSPCLIEGNSDRNIDVGFLIRKGLPFYFDVLSNKARPINYLYPHERQSLASGYPVKGGKVTTSHKFSRDVVELRLFTKDKEKPFLISLLTHLKSRLDPERIDPNGFERRQAELRTLLEIYRELEEKNPQIPIIVAGDFNGNAGKVNTDEEFKEIYTATELKDVFEVAGLKPEQRATFYQVKSSARTEGRQIDFVFLSPLAQPLLDTQSAKAFRYRDEFGSERGIPQTMEAKARIPSDHYPIVFELKNIKLG